MKKSTKMQRLAVNEILNGRLSAGAFRLFFKYDFDDTQRENILRRLPSTYESIVYSNPFPNLYEDIANTDYSYDSDKTLLDEVKWCFDSILKFKNQLKKFQNYNDTLEKYILSNNFEDALNLLDKIDEEISTSMYSLCCEFYINENSNNTDENKQIITALYQSSAAHKIQLLAEFKRAKIENHMSSWQYDTTVDQHKKLYDDQQKQYIDYITFKLDPIKYDIQIENLSFITAFESDFAIIDRYLSIKKILVLALSRQAFSQISEKVYYYAKILSEEFTDPFWQHFLLLRGYETQIQSDRADLHYLIQDLFFLGKYSEVIDKCKHAFITHPNYSENYIFFIQSLLFLQQEVEQHLPANSELKEILRLLKAILEKTQNYYLDREKLLKKYYAISDFDFSNPILEFVLNELNFSNSDNIHYSVFLHTTPLRYNFYKEIDNKKTQLSITKSLSKYVTFEYLDDLIIGSGNLVSKHPLTFFQSKLKIGYLMSIKKYNEALIELETYSNSDNELNKIDFITTWYTKNAVRCFVQLKQFDKAADLIVEYFFKKGVAYDHFYDQTLFENLSESEEAENYSNISIPILFQIYNQPTSTIYDSVANFLVNNNVFKPSELLELFSNWPFEKFNFLLEKCFTRENIDDSPFLNSIEILEQERITILNFLKEVDKANNGKYNEEILKITKEASIRKGLMQIHESRIYVDVVSLNRLIKLQYNEMFERYIEFSDLSFSQVYTLKLNDDGLANKNTYYFEVPLDETILPLYDILNNFETDPNAIKVPYIRYVFFESLFEEINQKFVFDEDYGFKSFLSMRIRHGTFSNVLRNVFDKYNLISSKESNSQDYGEIDYWNIQHFDAFKKQEMQKHLKKFSEEIDALIDEALSWVQVMMIEETEIAGMFNFTFLPGQLFNIFRNRLGKITSFHDFIEQIFVILFERLEQSLAILRELISDKLTPSFLTLLATLQKNIELLGFEEIDFRLIEKEILDCSTEIQVVTSQIVNWFKISRNQYIEEFPIDLILQTIVDYMNSINQNALTKAKMNIKNQCNVKFKGRYFESFGDIFINLFDNIINKNKSLEEALTIDIEINNVDDMLQINFKNNLPEDTDFEALELNLNSTLDKIENYQNGSIISFEQGSGYLKLCKSISADLNREKYSIVPRCEDKNFIVNLSFDLTNLTA